CAPVVISPLIIINPVVTSASQATRPVGSWRNTSSRMLSEIWSAILSGCPSVTDSDVNRNLPCCLIVRSPHMHVVMIALTGKSTAQQCQYCQNSVAATKAAYIDRCLFTP